MVNYSQVMGLFIGIGFIFVESVLERVYFIYFLRAQLLNQFQYPIF